MFYHKQYFGPSHNLQFFPNSFSRSSSASRDLTILYLIYSTGFVSTCPNHLRLFFTIFSTIGATPTLSSIYISNPITSSLTTHPTQHSHVRYAYFILVFLHRPTLCSIQTEQILLYLGVGTNRANRAKWQK